MGLFNIFGLRASVLLVAALITPIFVFAAGPVSVDISPTTSHYILNSDSVRPPTGTSVAVTSPSVPVVSKIPNGLSQTVGGGITITSIQRTAPLSARFNAYLPTLKKGAKSAVKGGLAGVAVTVALEALLDGIQGLIDDAGNISRAGYPDPIGELEPTEYDRRIVSNQRVKSNVPDSEIAIKESNMSYDYTCQKTSSSFSFIGWSSVGSTPYCYYSGTGEPAKPPLEPIPQPEIDNWIDNNFSPNEDDWTWIAPHMQPDAIEITSLPTLSTPPVTTTFYDSNGDPHSIQETNISYDFAVRNNNSSKPEIDMTKTEETKTYVDGVLTGTSSTTTTSPSSDVPVAGGGGVKVPTVEIPTDCDFHPTLCAWMDWTKQNDLDDEPDLKQIMHDFEPTNTNFTVTGSKSCPAPYPIYVGIVGKTYDLSFEPACTFAGYLYFFVMAGAYVYAAYITLGVARNG